MALQHGEEFIILKIHNLLDMGVKEVQELRQIFALTGPFEDTVIIIIIYILIVLFFAGAGRQFFDVVNGNRLLQDGTETKYETSCDYRMASIVN